MMENSDKQIEQKIREILEGLECILTGPCIKCDNRCIESAIKDHLPDVEVVIQ
jgi:hypothetical protein